MIKRLLPILIVFLGICSSVQSQIQSPEKTPTTRILIIFDASQSMLGKWQSDSKFNIARKLVYEMLDSIVDVPNTELALRLYGHQFQFPPQVCSDTKLEVPFAPNNIEKIKARLKRSSARGTTPLAYSLEQAANDFPKDNNSRNIVVLITDGIEECDGDPCAVSAMLQKKGIFLKPFIIGIGQDFDQAFHCVGTYFDATNEKDFKTALNVVISQALNSTTMQVNLLDKSGKPTETDVAMTFIDTTSGKIMYNYIHTMNSKGLPDTLVIDPLITYKIIAHTIPPVESKPIVITPGKHSIAAIDAPQGYLNIKMSGSSNASKNIKCKIFKPNACEIVNYQNIGETQKYIIGDYNIMIPTLPNIELKDVNIAQSSTTTIEIPEPGIAVIRKSFFGNGVILHYNNNSVSKIFDLNEKQTLETLYLQPGKYHIVFRPKSARSTIYTTDRTFIIESGKTTDVSLY